MICMRWGSKHPTTLVAEGIESESQMNVLIEQGCTIGQGYLFSKPVAPGDFEELMKISDLVADKMEQSNLN
ncbi:EAL domain-containing protein [Planococcus sp. MERTA32b]|nr:EAL domain-containing protein [Planococcus sp. MER TA 32b]